MRRNRVLITVGCCLLAVTVAALAQTARKPGLWETTAVMTMQQSPFPPGMDMSQMPNSPFSGKPMITKACLTQVQIDKFGTAMPHEAAGCKTTNISNKPTGMTVEMVCSGQMNGTMHFESSFPDGIHAKGTMHFKGAMQTGANPTPFEFTVNSTSVYKGADCGSVKPLPLDNY